MATRTTTKAVSYLSVSQSGAHRAIEATTKAAEKAGHAVSIAVVDRGGWLVAFRRMDKGVAGGVDGAIEKARSAAKFQDSLTTFASMAEKGQTWLGDLPGMIPLGGAEPLKNDDEVVGAIAVSGATEPIEQSIAASAAESFNG